VFFDMCSLCYTVCYAGLIFTYSDI